MCRAQPSSMAVRSSQITEDVCFKQVSISLQELQSQLFNSRYLLMLSSSVGQPRALGASSLALCVGVTAGPCRVVFGDTAHRAGTGAACVSDALFLLVQAKPHSAGDPELSVICATLLSNLCHCCLYFRD